MKHTIMGIICLFLAIIAIPAIIDSSGSSPASPPSSSELVKNLNDNAIESWTFVAPDTGPAVATDNYFLNESSGKFGEYLHPLVLLDTSGKRSSANHNFRRASAAHGGLG